jgi:hypothetical protein
MSAIRKIELADAKQVAQLAEALKLMNPACAEHLSFTATRTGLHVSRENRGCALVLSSRFFHGVEDVGWVQKADSGLRMIYDEDDEYRLDDAFGTEQGDFASTLKQYYNAAVAKKHLEDTGYNCEVHMDDAGEVHVTGTAW